MKDNKLTPEEIKKALECCADTDDGCLHCPLYGSPAPECGMRLCRESLELHKSQQAEIEELKEKRLEDDKLLNDRVQEAINSVSKANNKYVNALERAFNDRVAELKTAKAEIERLNNEVIAKEYEYNDMLEQRNSVEYNLELLKQEKSVVIAEAIKEFAERLKKHSYFDQKDQRKVVAEVIIDHYIKEMVGDDK